MCGCVYSMLCYIFNIYVYIHPPQPPPPPPETSERIYVFSLHAHKCRVLLSHIISLCFFQEWIFYTLVDHLRWRFSWKLCDFRSEGNNSLNKSVYVKNKNAIEFLSFPGQLFKFWQDISNIRETIVSLNV